MPRVKKVRRKPTVTPGVHPGHETVWVDTKTGEEFPDPEAVRTGEQFKEIRALPEPERKEELIAAARERERLPPTPTELVETQQQILERERLKREGIPEEVIPEELPPVELPLEEVPEKEGVVQQMQNAYSFVDTMGGIIPEESQKDLEMGTIPIGFGAAGLLGVKQGKAVLNTAKAVTGTRAVKLWDGMLKVMKSKAFVKAFKWGGLGYVYLTERKVANMDSALSQVRESITIPVSMAAANPLKINDAWDMIADLEEDVNGYEADLQLWLIENSLTIGLTGRLLPVKQRIKKLRAAIDLARDQISKIEAAGAVLTDEETALVLGEMNEILNSMENPTKFLGII